MSNKKHQNQALRDKERQLAHKEEELTKLMKEYYEFDMNQLSTELQGVLKNEIHKLDASKDDRLKNLYKLFNKITHLSEEHLKKGSAYQSLNELKNQQDKNGQNEDENSKEIMKQFDEQTQEYEDIISQANTQKQQLRNEIAVLEADVRTNRDAVADLQVENRNLQYIIDRESEVQSKKDQIEKKALTVVSKDLSEQLSQLQDNAEKLTGKVTPYFMESILQQKLVDTSKQYDEYIHESQVDLDGTNQDILVLEKELERERIISEGLQKQKNNNQRQLDELSAEFNTYKKELDNMNYDHDQKLNELHQIRQKANEEIKHLSIELGQQQGEINVLILETKKYESQLEFLTTERGIILQAQMQAKAQTFTPEIQIISLENADQKRANLEKQLSELNGMWATTIDEIQSQTEQFMSENEMKEFKARINVLVRELNDKNRMIEIVAKEKKELEATEKKVGNLGLEIGDHQQEIDELNGRYQVALKEKVDVYEELVESLKELTQRHSKYLKNEVSLTEMQNMCNILKKQLEQKEKINEDIRQQDLFYMNPQLLNQVEKKIEEMQGKLKDVRAEIRVKDQELQFLELVVEDKMKNQQQKK